MDSISTTSARQSPLMPEQATSELVRAFTGMLEDQRCLFCTGPAQALFATPQAGGDGLRNYMYTTFTQGGPKRERESSGEGFSDWDEAQRTFLSVLRQYLKPGYPVVIRVWPEASKSDTGRWYIYSRLVQLDFQADSMLVQWDLHGHRP